MKKISVTLHGRMGGDDEAAFSAWVSTGKEMDNKTPVEIDQMLHRLAKEGHYGCFEHNVASFFVDCPIYISRQIVRQRTFSFNELSGRYKNLGKQGAMIPDNSSADEFYNDAYRHAFIAYDELIARGEPKERARAVLPVGTMTRLKITANLRNLHRFITLRSDHHAQAEIQEVARSMLDLLVGIWPRTMFWLSTYPEVRLGND